jgi:hypothetical protein
MTSKLTQRLLADIRMQGKPVHTLDPRKPYKLLGVWFTMDLSWHKQKQDIKQTLQAHGSPPRQKL